MWREREGGARTATPNLCKPKVDDTIADLGLIHCPHDGSVTSPLVTLVNRLDRIWDCVSCVTPLHRREYGEEWGVGNVGQWALALGKLTQLVFYSTVVEGWKG
jgi:hypothetical protein